MIPYLLHTVILLSGCFLFYKWLLESETFFRLNRLTLLSGMVLAFCLPLIQVPEAWSLRVPELLNPRPAIEQGLNLLEEEGNEKAITSKPQSLENKEDSTLVSETYQVNEEKARPQGISLIQLVFYAYLAGLGLFLLNLLIQVGALFWQILRSPSYPDGPYRIVELSDEQAPFSFANYIFINPARYDLDTYEQILQHEKVHIAQWHSLDLFMAELLLAFQWFNPFAWMYRKALENNLEFLTDARVLSQGVAPQAYQMSLLRVSVPQYPLRLTNSYNQSFLKKRIAMMNSKKSSLHALWKYFLLIPAFGLAVVCLNRVYAPLQAQILEKVGINEKDKIEVQVEVPVQVPIETQVEADVMVEREISPAQNNSGFDIRQRPQGRRMQLSVRTRGNWLANKRSGIWRGWIEQDQVCINFDLSERSKRNIWMQSECFKRSEFSKLPMGEEGSFELKRDAGRVDFTGKFEGDEGYGRFTFEPNAEFQAYLGQQGFQEVDETFLFHLFMGNVGREYIAFLQQNGYADLEQDELKKLAIHQVSVKNIREYNQLFQKTDGKLSIQQIVKLSIHDVNPAFLKGMADLGYDDLSVQEAVRGSIHDLSPAYIRELQEAGFKNLSYPELIKMATHDVDAKFIKSMAELGFTGLSANELIKASIHDLDAAMVKDLQSVGYTNLSLNELMKLGIHDVNASYVRSLSDLGYTNLSVGTLIKAKIHDVEPRQVKTLAEAGYTKLSMEELIRMATHDVDPSYIKSLSEAGYTNLSPEQLVKASIHDLDPAFLKEMASLGYKNLSFEQAVKASIHEVDERFVKGLADLGFTNIAFDELIRARIHDVTPDFIQRMREKGFKDLSLEKYRVLKNNEF